MSRGSGSALSVLLVDDDKDLSDALADYLESQDLNVTASESCRTAIRHLQDPENKFHILLADLRLPDGDGLEVIQAARQQNQNILAAVMTGYASLDTALEAIRLGAYDYITKPFSLDEIDILVRNMSEKIRLMEENRKHSQQLSQVYSRMESLQDEKVELVRLNRRIQQEFDNLSSKLDQVLDYLELSTSPPGPQIRRLPIKRSL